MRTLFQDVSYSLRSLQKAKGFAAVSILTLALGIAANTIVFSVVNAALLHPLPYFNPDRLVVLAWYGPHGRLTQDISADAFFKLKEHARSFQSIGVHYAANSGVNLIAAGPPQYEYAQRVSGDFFRTLGVSPVIGREFTAEEDQAGGPGAIILSYGLWQQDYNGNPNVVGSQVRIDGESHTIVGVMPKGFRSYPEADLWLPLRLSPATAEVGNEYQVIARLQDNVTLQQAQQELTSTPEYLAAYPLHSLTHDVRLAADELQGFLVSGIRRSLYSLFGAVLFVLLISCTNLALLLTVRGANRIHEFAIRAALGSSRARLVRVFLMDGVIISLGGGVIGTVLGKELLPFITWLAPGDLPLSIPLHMDGQVLVFAVTISVVTIMLSGLSPAVKMSRVSLTDIIRQSPGTGRRMQKSRLGRLLVPLQIALTLFLLTGTVTSLQSFLQLRAVPPGFDSRNVLVAQISLVPSRYTSSSATSRLLNEVAGQIRNLPGVEAAATVSGLPLEQGLRITMFPADARDRTVLGETDYRIVSPGYFQVLRISLVAGRFFSESDSSGSAPVALISEGLARRWWPHESPLGRFVTTGGESGSQFSDLPRMVVGVVADVREAGLDRLPPPTVFVPLRQAPDTITAFVNRWFPASIIVRASSNVGLREPLSRVLASSDGELALMSLRPLTQILAKSLARPRFYVSLSGAFGIFALLLTAVGLYGLLNYQLISRVRELALRIAIGAKWFDVVGLVLKQGVGLVAVGVFLGSLTSFFLAKSLAAVIYNVPRTAFSSIFFAALLLLAIAFLTSLSVAVRTTAIEPMAVLRTE